MAQNLTSVLGSTANANAYLALVNSGYRRPIIKLSILNEDGTTFLDLSNFFMSASCQFTDEVAAMQGQFTVTNALGQFDKYGYGAYKTALDYNKKIYFQKGLMDNSGNIYMLPAFTGRIVSAVADYDRTNDCPTVVISCLDMMKNMLKQKVTTDAYNNTSPDAIASDVTLRYASSDFPTTATLALGGTSAGLPNYLTAQFPDMSIADILKTLYDPFLFYVKCDEAGRLVSAPRLGSNYSGFSGILGYPDATSAPPNGSVAYTFPDNGVCIRDGHSWSDLEGVNQVRVLGQNAAAIVQLGGTQALGAAADSSILATDTVVVKVYFSQNSAATNQVVASGVYVNFRYSTNHLLDSQPPVNAATGVLADTSFDSSNGIIVLSKQGQGEVIQNSDPHHVGYVQLQALTPTYAVLKIQGNQFSSGSAPARHHGGFDYNYTVYGQPALSVDKTLTGIADYNAVAVTENATNPFGDNQTFQLSHNPMCMGTPVEVAVNPSTLPSTTLSAAMAQNSLKLSVASATGITDAMVLKIGSGLLADYLTVATGGVSGTTITVTSSSLYSHASGDSVVALTGVLTDDLDFISALVKADFERARVVLLDLSYRGFTTDSGTAGLTVTGGTGNNSSTVFDLSVIDLKTPQAVYQTARYGEFTYTLTGLTVGQSYDIRLHLADDSLKQGFDGSSNVTVNGNKQNAFDVYVNSVQMLSDVDIWTLGGGIKKAVQVVMSGVTPDFSGTIAIQFTVHDPLTGYAFHPTNGVNTSTVTGFYAQVNGIEILLPQGQGASPYTINCGGSPQVAINATPPIVKVSYAYSLIQAQQGIQNFEINNPLIKTKADCMNVANFFLNYSAWQKNKLDLVTISVPHLQAGDMVKFYNPKLNADFWAYIQGIVRTVDRNTNEGDMDEYSLFLLYAQSR